MIPDESDFAPSLCRRCGRVVLRGHHGGLAWRLDPGIQIDAANLVTWFGLGVLVLRERLDGQLWASDFDPAHPPELRDVLAVAHRCGSAHSIQMQKGSHV